MHFYEKIAEFILKIGYMETKRERLERFIETMGYSIREFERAIGVSNGTISHVKDSLSANLKDKISANFQQLNMDWLLTGSGEMLRSSVSPATETQPEEETNERPQMKPVVSGGIPLIPIDAVAGFNGWDESGISELDCARYDVPDFAAVHADFLIRVSGSSMYPKYSSCDILACRKILEVTFIQWGKIYVIDSQQGAMVKRLFEIEGDAEHILCKSDNANYPPFKLPKNEIRSLSIVVGAIRLE